MFGEPGQAQRRPGLSNTTPLEARAENAQKKQGSLLSRTFATAIDSPGRLHYCRGPITSRSSRALAITISWKNHASMAVRNGARLVGRGGKLHEVAEGRIAYAGHPGG